MENYVKHYRRKSKITQKELAEKVYCSRVAISNIECNMYIPKLKLAFRLAEALKVNLEDLFEMDFEDYYLDEEDNI